MLKNYPIIDPAALASVSIDVATVDPALYLYGDPEPAVESVIYVDDASIPIANR